jgi:hypothetical protein
MLKKCGGYLILLVLVSGFSWAWAQGQGTRSFLVMGAVSSQGQGALDARNRAEQAALRQAVERFILESLPETSMQSSMGALAPLLKEDPASYVRDFRILATVQEGPGYRVVARVSLDLERLTQRMKDLGLGLSRMPGILFMVSEQGLGDAEPKRWWEPNAGISGTGGRCMEGLVAVLEPAGFSMVLPDGRSLLGGERTVAGVLDMREAQRMGALFGAPVVLVGRARVAPGGNVMGERLQSFRAEISLIALDTEKGDVLAEVEDALVVVNEHAAAGEREALYQLGSKAGSRMAQELRSVWQRRVARDAAVSEIRMDIRGDQYLSRFVHFRKVLGEIEGVVSIERREISAQGMDIRVRYQGPASALASALLSQSYERFGIRISDVEEGRMQVTLISSP